MFRKQDEAAEVLTTGADGGLVSQRLGVGVYSVIILAEDYEQYTSNVEITPQGPAEPFLAPLVPSGKGGLKDALTDAMLKNLELWMHLLVKPFILAHNGQVGVQLLNRFLGPFGPNVGYHPSPAYFPPGSSLLADAADIAECSEPYYQRRNEVRIELNHQASVTPCGESLAGQHGTVGRLQFYVPGTEWPNSWIPVGH